LGIQQLERDGEDVELLRPGVVPERSDGSGKCYPRTRRRLAIGKGTERQVDCFVEGLEALDVVRGFGPEELREQRALFTSDVGGRPMSAPRQP